MSFDTELHQLAERAKTLKEQGGLEEKRRGLLASLFGLSAQGERDVTVEEAGSPGQIAAPEQVAARARASDTEGPSGRARAEGPGHLVCVGGTPVALASFTASGELREGSPQKEAEPLCRLLAVSDLRFGVLAGRRRFRFFASFGDPRRPVLDFDLLARKRHRAQKLKTLVRTILTFVPAGDGPAGDDLEGSRPEGSHLEGSHLEKSHSAGAGHGLLYVLAVDNGKPFGMRKTACKFGITGKRLESRRRFHEWRLGIRGSEEMRLCYLAAGSVVAAEKIVRRRTARKAPPGLRPWSEWRWCAPRWLVRQVKAAARGEIRAETDRLGLNLTYQILHDPLSSAPPAGLLPAGDGKQSRQETRDREENPLETRLSPSAALRRAAGVKRTEIQGDLGERSDENTLRFRTGGREYAFLRECYEQSAYRSWSHYARDQALGWSQGASIVGKAGLIVHWASARWGEEVGDEGWSQLWGLLESFFNPGCISKGTSSSEGAGLSEEKSSPAGEVLRPGPLQGESFQEGVLGRVLGLVKRHLLVVEPRALQLLKEQLVTMRQWEELGHLTDSGKAKSPPASGDRTGRSWASEIKQMVLGVSGKEEGCRTPKNFRLSETEREVVMENAQESSYANPSSYVRNAALGWDRDALIVARAATVTSWLLGRQGQKVGRNGWKSLEIGMQEAFDPGYLPGDTVRQGLRATEEHLLRASREKVAQETGISVS